MGKCLSTVSRLFVVLLAIAIPPFVAFPLTAAEASPDGSWEVVRGPTHILSDVSFVDANNGWTAGSGGTILRTSDGGATWSSQNSGTFADLHAITFVNSSNGWVVGSGGAIRNTSNGGANWSAQTSANTQTLLSVSFVDVNNGWAVGFSGTIQRTSNGGNTWTLQTSGTTQSLYGVDFADTSNGWAVGFSGTIQRTSNGGSTWTAQISNTTSALIGASFLDSNQGWVVGEAMTILSSPNGGANWLVINQAPSRSYMLTGVDFVTSTDGWAVTRGIASGKGYGGAPPQETVTHTSDGGITWSGQSVPTTGASLLNGVSFIDSIKGWAVGPNGATFHTADGGITWVTQTSGPTQTLTNVRFVDADNGWAVGNGGAIRSTSDGGNTWNAQVSGTTQTLYGVSFVDANNGWAVGGGGTIRHTMDGGDTWNPQVSNTTQTLYSVRFVDANDGWAVGGGGIILHTPDGGNTWMTQVTGSPGGTLYSVSFVDSNNGWAVGNVGTVRHTSNGGATWVSQPSGVNVTLRGVSAIDSTHAVAVGDYGVILRNHPVDPPPSIAKARFSIATRHEYHTNNDTVGNVPLDFQLNWALSVQNLDQSKAIPHLTISANASTIGPITGISRSANVTGDTYVWEFDNVAPGGMVGSTLLDGTMARLTPGFSSSRQVDKAIFDSPSVQTLTVTATPLDRTGRIGAYFQPQKESGENDLVRWEVIGASSQSTADPVLGQTYTYQFTLNVTPKAGPLTFLPEFYVIQGNSPPTVEYSDVTSVTTNATDSAARVLTGTATTSLPAQTFLAASGTDFRQVYYDMVATAYVHPGDNVTVNDTALGVAVTFEQVTTGGNLEVSVSDQPPAPTSGFTFADKYYNVVTEANYTGNITLTIAYTDSDIPIGQQEEDLRLLHWTGLAWEDVTVSLDTANNKITGVVSSLSWLSIAIPPKVTWLPPLSTATVYAAQDGSTVPIKFQLTDSTGNTVSATAVVVTITRDSDGAAVLNSFAVYDAEIQGYRLNAQTRDWLLGDYTIRLSVNGSASYGMSIVDKGQAKGKQK